MARTKTLWIHDEYLEQILGGEKRVEVRVGYENIRRLNPDDILLLNDEHRYRICDIRSYSSHEELIDVEETSAIAPRMSDEELLAALREIYPPEKEQLGVYALEIEPIDETGSHI